MGGKLAVISENVSERKSKRRVFDRLSREWFAAAAVAFVFALLVSFLMIRWLESAITFHPAKSAAGDSPTLPASAQDVWFTTTDGVRLHGWKFTPSTKPTASTVIYFHGNGGNITNVGWVGKLLASRGLGVLIFDYRGYGFSEGLLRNEDELYRDADAAYDFVTGNGASNIVLYGQSLGTAAVADLASRRPCSAIILESGLSSASDMAATVLPWFPRSLHFVLRNRFDSVHKLSKVQCPVLITHGDPDPIIPTEQGRLLFASANEPKKLLIFPGAGHNVFGSAGKSYLDTIASFAIRPQN